MKPKTVFVCQDCGYESPKWLGQCPNCHAWNTFQEVTLTPQKNSGGRNSKSAPPPLSLKSVASGQKQDHWPTGFREVDRVLGGGVIPGAVMLLAGEPGIGKSTLLSQLALSLAQKKQRQIYYVCGEESPQQVKLRLRRLAPKLDLENFFLVPQIQMETALAAVKKQRHGQDSLVIVDSIQTMVSQDAPGGAGSVSQTRAATNSWLRFAKETQTPVFLVGHVTKAGMVAGPKTLEHMVDVVLYFEGDRYHQLRLLRAAKNRFGPTDEIGVWQMTGRGLEEVNPAKLWAESSAKTGPSIGAAATIVLEGSRPLALEIQALVSQSFLPTPKRVINGLDYNRAQIVLAVLQKYLRLPLFKYDVFINVSGGLQTREPAADLALAASILSSYHNRPLPAGSWFLGEVSLLGQVRPVGQLERRRKQAQSLGLKKLSNWQTTPHLRQLKLEKYQK